MLPLDLRSPKRVFWVSLATLATFRFTFAALTLQYHVEGDTTVSLLQANDWLKTPHRMYFWGQTYMGTSEVWLFSSVWRLFFGGKTIPLLYWVFIAQTFYALGAALVMAGLVYTDAEHWSRRRVFILSLAVIGISVPVFSKSPFALGHGYSAVPLYAGLTVALYLFRDRLHPWLFALAGVSIGHGHYIFRMHILFGAALAGVLVLAGPKAHLKKALALAAGVALGMLPEQLFMKEQAYSPWTGLPTLELVRDNAWITIRNLSVHFGTLPDFLVESEHSMWFVSHRPLPADWTFWGERIGAGLCLILFALDVRRTFRSNQYWIFSAILLVNFVAVATTYLVLDVYGARRYMYLSLFSVPFLMLAPPWTPVHILSIALRLGALAVYTVAALLFTVPLAEFREVSRPMKFSERRDCLAGAGGDLSALLALNDLKVKTIDFDWRLKDNYSRNVEMNPEQIRKRCRQVFWIQTRDHPKSRLDGLCELDDKPYYEGSPKGIVEYPQHAAFWLCRVPK